jgi:hypothetical protein
MTNALFPLPTSGFISGRIATEADVNAGDAVFFIKGDGVIPAAITIPQFAIWREDQDAEGKFCAIVQAEMTTDGVLVGLRDADGSNAIATLPELELLGQEIKK